MGVFGGRIGLKIVEAGLNWEVFLTGETGRDLEGESSFMGDIARFVVGRKPGLTGRFNAFLVGVFGNKARALFDLGVGFVGEGAIRARNSVSQILMSNP